MNGDGPILLPGAGPDDEPPEEAASQQPPGHSDQIPLAPPKLWTRGFLLFCAIIAVAIAFLLREMTVTFDEELPTTMWFLPLGAVIVLSGIRRVLIPRKARVIRFDDQLVELPKSRNSRRTLKVAYDQILTIVPLVSRGQPALVIDTPKRTQIYLADDFPHPEFWRVLWAQLVDRIAAHPAGFEQLRQMRQRAALSQEASAVKGRFTRKIFWVITAIFAAQVFLAPPVSVLEFLYFGANSPLMVFGEGQWWRVVTANLLHGNGVHFAVNAFALYFLGTYCERLFGEVRTMVLILGTALVGAAASLIGAEAMFAVGISTALFGLVGAYFALHLRFGPQLPPPYRQTRLWWIVILGLNGVLSFAIPIIDAWGHLGGFVAGLALGWLMTRGQEEFRPRPESGRPMSIAAASLIALFTACTFVAVTYAVGDQSEDEILVAQALLDRFDEEESIWLAQVAQEWSVHTPRPAQVDSILLELSHRVVRETGDYYAFRWATEAIVNIATETGPAHLAPSPFQDVRLAPRGIALEPTGPLEHPRWVYLLAGPDDEQPSHLMSRCIPAGDAPGEPAQIAAEVPEPLTLSLAMVVAADGCTDDESRFWRATPVKVYTATGP